MATFGTMCRRICLLPLRNRSLKIECLPNYARLNRHEGRTLYYASGSPVSSNFSRSYVTLSRSNTRLRLVNCCNRPVIPRSALTSLGSKRLYTKDNSQQSGSITGDLLRSKIAQSKNEELVGEQDKKSNSDQNKDEKKKDSRFTGKNAWKLGIIMLGGMSVFSGCSLLVMWGAPSIDENGMEVVDEYTPLPKWQAYPKRAFKEFHFFKKMIQEPSSDKLLPDPLKEPYYQPPYTLVLEMTGVLVHPDWTLNTGWRFKKRPAVTYFLQQVGPPLFEVVIYTKEQGFTAFPIIDGLDPHGMVSFRLFRDATRYIDGAHCKDLACLNRDLSRVIVVDCDPKAVSLHPSNALRLKKWAGSDDDRVLLDLAAFLRTLAISGVEDVRPILDYYSQFDDPLETFKENQRKLQEEQEKSLMHKKEQDEAKQPLKNWGFSLSGRRR